MKVDDDSLHCGDSIDQWEQFLFRTFLKALNVVTEIVGMMTSKRGEAVQTLDSVVVKLKEKSHGKENEQTRSL